MKHSSPPADWPPFPVLECCTDSRWTPAYCKPRTEKVVADYCARHGIPCYLPLLRQKRRYQRRTVEVLLPMFRGYVFVRLGLENRTLFLECHRIVHLVEVDEVQERMLVAELQGIQIMERAQGSVELEVMPDIRPGTPVTITDGPLRGTSGVVETRRGKTRVVVNVELLGRAVVAEMDLGELEADTES
jgi:transcription antitermination factor NusG